MTYVIVFHEGNWVQTLACLQALFNNVGETYKVIVCGVDDDSDWVDHIYQWSQFSEQTTVSSKGKALRSLSNPLDSRIVCRRLTDSEASLAVNTCVLPEMTRVYSNQYSYKETAYDAAVELAAKQADMSHIWLLKNHVIVETDALAKLHRVMNQQNGVILCRSRAVGSVDAVDWFSCDSGDRGSNKTNTKGLSYSESIDINASVLVSRRYLNNIGLFEYDSVFFYQELCWAIDCEAECDMFDVDTSRYYFQSHYAPYSIDHSDRYLNTPHLLAS